VIKRVFPVASLVFLLGWMCVFPGQKNRSAFAKSLDPAGYPQQDYSKKTTEDYLETVLSRNTKPLGLKENVVLRNLLKQPSIKWAVRAGIRHILD